MSSKRYDEEFKKATVKYIIENQKTVAEVARELGIKDDTLYDWKKKYSPKEPIMISQGGLPPSAAEMRAIKKQLEDLQEENEILKKAMHFFAKNHR